MLKDDYSGEHLLEKTLDEMSDKDVDFFLARFVAEVRKQDGQDYPGKTIYEMICSLQRYLECKRDLCLIDKKDGRFSSLNSAVNFILKERAGRGLGTDTNQVECITSEHIDYRWEKGLLGSNNSELPKDTPGTYPEF